jgi:hypothetical protein
MKPVNQENQQNSNNPLSEIYRKLDSGDWVVTLAHNPELAKALMAINDSDDTAEIIKKLTSVIDIATQRLQTLLQPSATHKIVAAWTPILSFTLCILFRNSYLRVGADNKHVIAVADPTAVAYNTIIGKYGGKEEGNLKDTTTITDAVAEEPILITVGLGTGRAADF